MDKLRTSRSLELIEALRETVSEFAKREEQLTRAGAAGRFAINHALREANTKEEESAAARKEAAAVFEREEAARLEAIFQARKSRVERFRTHSLRTLPKRAREARENWMGDQQMRLVAAEKDRQAKLAAADAAFAEISATLAVQRDELAAIHRDTRRSFAGYRTFRQLLRGRGNGSTELRHPREMLEQLERDVRRAAEELRAFRRSILPQVFRYLPLPVLALLALGAGAEIVRRMGANAFSYSLGAVASTLLFGAIFAVHRLTQRQSENAARDLAATLSRANASGDALRSGLEQKHAEERASIEADHERAHAEIENEWNRAGEIEMEFQRRAMGKIETQAPRVLATIDELARGHAERLTRHRDARVSKIESEAAARMETFSGTHGSELAQHSSDDELKWAELETEWKRAITPLYDEISALDADARNRFRPWDDQLVEAWSPPVRFSSDTKFAQLEVDVTKLAPALPKSPRLALPGSPEISLPLALSFPEAGSLLFETKESGGAEVNGALNDVILRLLATTPPGKVAFTIIDPVGLGQNFAGLMHLADYEESLINRRIWTQTSQIEERLAELNEHIEKVIQMYLRNEYATISEYNEQAGSVAEKYQFLVVADFPAGFSETAARRLQSIAVSGPRCGVFTLMHWDQRQPLPDGFVADELRKNSIVIRREPHGFVLVKNGAQAGVTLRLDAAPEAELAAALVHKIGKSSIDSNRVEVPFSQIAPPPDEMWKSETTTELKVAIGRTGATKLQYLAIGKGTRQHALFAGKTGSGKSTLFHVIITNLALWCSPEQVEFYLIDFKKGVEFKCYAEKRLPHARVVAIESDREFALSVLQRVDEELKRRGDIFRKLGVQDLAGYQRAGGAEPMPRTLLIIDEFQEFFVEDDVVSQTASLLFDRIVRQGRAFGIHVLLGSQTLGGAYTLARATLGQMVIRVALQCNEADAYLIMDENNSAPRLLSRPGEGIYNDAAGAVEGNSPFQVVWLADEERDRWLDKVRAVAEQRSVKQAAPIVFEGNAPADIRDNERFTRLLEKSESAKVPSPARCWLGAPNAIKGPTEVVFPRQSGANLLIVGQREEAALTMLGLALLTLAAQDSTGGARFFFLHNAPPASPDAAFIDSIASAVSSRLTLVRSHEVAAAMATTAAELKTRMSGTEDAPPIFVFIHGLHRFKKLRHEDDFAFSMSDADAGANPGAQFNELITEGSGHGIHLLASLDTFGSVNRFISRKAMSEWEMRVVFQMSANDSASLIDSPKAANLGLHRAIFYNERESTLETFRPYATPDHDWLQTVAERLAGRRGPDPAVLETAMSSPRA